MIYYTWRPQNRPERFWTPNGRADGRVSETIRANLRDEADNHLIELTVAGNAEYIVTQNIRDFQGPQLYFPELTILTPDDFMKEVV